MQHGVEARRPLAALEGLARLAVTGLMVLLGASLALGELVALALNDGVTTDGAVISVGAAPTSGHSTRHVGYTYRVAGEASPRQGAADVLVSRERPAPRPGQFIPVRHAVRFPGLSALEVPRFNRMRLTLASLWTLILSTAFGWYLLVSIRGAQGEPPSARKPGTPDLPEGTHLGLQAMLVSLAAVATFLAIEHGLRFEYHPVVGLIVFVSLWLGFLWTRRRLRQEVGRVLWMAVRRLLRGKAMAGRAPLRR